jgi:hydroxymethylglutaryl-CoA reductase
MMTAFTGFSKLDREQRIKYIVENSQLKETEGLQFNDFCSRGETGQKVLEDMIENYIGNFPLPLGVVANMLINDETLTVPFVTEESSVVAAASKAAKYWSSRGGFKAVVRSMTKKGQVHFTWDGSQERITELFPEIRKRMLHATDDLTGKMRQRGGGITAIQLIDRTMDLPDYYQIDASFETADAMGANFINSCLETFASVLTNISELKADGHQVEVIMSILSNYSPDCIVNCFVECPADQLTDWSSKLSGKGFASKFRQAVDIANLDINRAVTHNKGIFNGIDAVLLATGNDWRAAAAAAHTYASRNGSYRGLTSISLTDKIFRYELEIPLSVGTVGGITSIHPVVKKSMAMMNYPDARKLMTIVAASGLASNFSAIASLITNGIQEGHMRLHLSNILSQLQACQSERERALSHFKGKTVSYSAVEAYISQLRACV